MRASGIDRRRTALGLAGLALLVSLGCSAEEGTDSSSSEEPVSTPDITAVASTTMSTASTVGEIDQVVDIGGRSLYLRCRGSGSPTVIMEGGDEDTSSSYGFAVVDIAAVTRTCVYDRANLGRSDPAEGPRGLSELVGDLEALLDSADVEGPYVLVGTSGGGYITAGFAFAHPDEVAGMVFVETPSPFVDPPQEIVELTAWDSPSNIEKRDYLQVEKDAWAGRTEIGDIPVTVISNDYGPNAEFPGEQTNVEDQKGWLVLSPSAKQIVVTTGHAVEEADPQLVIEAILDVVAAAS